MCEIAARISTLDLTPDCPVCDCLWVTNGLQSVCISLFHGDSSLHRSLFADSRTETAYTDLLNFKVQDGLVLIMDVSSE